MWSESRPGPGRHGGQRAEPGVTGSRTLFSCDNRTFAGGFIGPDMAARAAERGPASGNSTLTLE